MAWTKHPRQCSTFPHEILVKIFHSLEQRLQHRHTSMPSISFTPSYTLDRSDIVSCALVCHDWYYAAVDTLWRDIDLQSVESFIRFGQAVDRSFEYVEALHTQVHIATRPRPSKPVVISHGKNRVDISASVKERQQQHAQQHRDGDASDHVKRQESANGSSSLESSNIPTISTAVGYAGKSYIRSLSFAQLVSCHEPRPFPYLPSCLTDRHMMQLAPSLGDRLTSLSLRHCSTLTDMAIVEVVTASSSYLKHIDLTECRRISNLAVQIIACLCAQLEQISLQGCGLVTDDAVVDIGRFCPRLQEINLGQCQRVGDRGILALLQMSGPPPLTGIEEQADSNVNLNEPVWSPIDYYSTPRKRLPHLRKINVAGCRGVTFVGLMAIATFHNANSQDPRNHCQTSRQPPTPTLSSFEFTCPVQRSGTTLGGPHHSLASVLSLKATPSLATRIFSVLPQTVQELTIEDAYLLTSADISCLVERLGPQLRVLRLDNGHSVTTNVMELILDHCPALRVLSVPRALQLTNDGVVKIAKAECAKTLVELDLSAAYELTDSCLLDIVSLSGSGQHPQQRQQQRSEHNNHGDDGNTSSIDGGNATQNGAATPSLMPNLMRLDLSFNAKMTLKGIRSLVLALPSLCTLDVSYCGAGITTPMPVASSPRGSSLSPILSTVGSRMHQANLLAVTTADSTASSSTSTPPVMTASQTAAQRPAAIAASYQQQRRANLRAYVGPLLNRSRPSYFNNLASIQHPRQYPGEEQDPTEDADMLMQESDRRLSVASTSSSSSSSSSSTSSSDISSRSTYASSSRASSYSSSLSPGEEDDVDEDFIRMLSLKHKHVSAAAEMQRLCERLDVIELTPRQVPLPYVYIQNAWFSPRHHLQLQQLAQLHFQQQDHHQPHLQPEAPQQPVNNQITAEGAAQNPQQQQPPPAVLSHWLLTHPVMAAPRVGVATIVQDVGSTSRYSLRALGLEANELQGHCEISGWGLSKLREEWEMYVFEY